MVALREPALGPTFGIKGGATGGDMRRFYLWKILIYTLTAISMQLQQRITIISIYRQSHSSR